MDLGIKSSFQATKAVLFYSKGDISSNFAVKSCCLDLKMNCRKGLWLLINIVHDILKDFNWIEKIAVTSPWSEAERTRTILITGVRAGLVLS